MTASTAQGRWASAEVGEYVGGARTLGRCADPDPLRTQRRTDPGGRPPACQRPRLQRRRSKRGDDRRNRPSEQAPSLMRSVRDRTAPCPFKASPRNPGLTWEDVVGHGRTQVVGGLAGGRSSRSVEGPFQAFPGSWGWLSTRLVFAHGGPAPRRPAVVYRRRGHEVTSWAADMTHYAGAGASGGGRRRVQHRRSRRSCRWAFPHRHAGTASGWQTAAAHRAEHGLPLGTPWTICDTHSHQLDSDPAMAFGQLSAMYRARARGADRSARSPVAPPRPASSGATEADAPTPRKRDAMSETDADRRRVSSTCGAIHGSTVPFRR